MPVGERPAGYRERLYVSYGEISQDAPDRFDRAASLRWGRARRYYLRRWLPQERDARMVDVGCGSGMLLHFLSGLGYEHVEGVDISPDQVALSRQVAKDVTEGNAMDFLDAHVEQFDLITALDVIEHFHKDEVLRFLSAAHGSLRPKGRLILQTPNAGRATGLQQLYGDFGHEVGFTPTMLSRLLSHVGFEHIAARECPPPPYGYSLSSSLRFLLWQVIRLPQMALNVIETGAVGDRILTRAFLMTGIKHP
jgi:2-polyprenyl-3-methyl-5-hydroxy-6-metoxy-1,4-benzoquinol methylase